MDCAGGSESSKHVMERLPRRRVSAVARAGRPALLVAAVAMAMVMLSGEAYADCSQTVAGEVLNCAGATSNPAAFDATGDFSITLEGEPTPADITRDDGNPGLTVNAGDNSGDITMEGGASIAVQTDSGGGHGLVITSSATTTEKTYTVNIGGMITTLDSEGDALRLEGTDLSTFDVVVGADGILGSWSGGDEGVLVDGALDFSLRNRGIVAGANGNGVQVRNVEDDVRIVNAFGGRIVGYGNGIWIDEVEDNVAINNSFGGWIGGGDDGIDIDDVDGSVRIANMFGGRIWGAESGIRIDGVEEDVAINNSFGGRIAGGDDGIDIEDVDGDVNIINRFGGRIAGGDNGIVVTDVEDDVAIDNSFGGRIRGHDDVGIDLDDIDGDVSIANMFGGRITGDENGIRVRDVEEDVAIDNSFGGLVRGYGGDGVELSSIDGLVLIGNRSGEIEGRRDGIDAERIEGPVGIVNSFGGAILGVRGDGIDLDDIDDDVLIANGFGGRITGGENGVKIRDVWNGDVRIANSFGGRIRGEDGNGIDIREIDGDVIVANMFGGRITGDEHGIRIRDVDGDVAINSSFGRVRGRDEDGIAVRDVDDDVVIANIHGRITGDDDGISIDDVSDDVAIYNAGGNIRGRDGDGIVITDADGRVTIENGRGRIVGDDRAIAIEAESVVIDSAGLIRGEGSGRRPTIALSTEYGATIDNRKGGLIRGDDKSAYDLIIAAEGGEVEINNRGDMIGRIDLSSAGDTGDGNVVNNYSDDSWTFTGTSEFGDGLADEFNNTGTTHTTDPEDPSANDTTTLAGLESFNNGDAFNDGTLAMQDGYTGDETRVTPTSNGTLVFAGAAGHSYLSVDGYLGTASNSESDRLVIDGDVAGATGVTLTDLNTGFGSYNPDGTVVVDVNGETDAGDFFLVGGPVDKGLFQYDLALNPSNEWVLASAPNQRFFELPSLVSAAQTMWQSSAGVWLDRTADLRSARAAACAGGEPGGLKDEPVAACGAGVARGAWAKVLGTSVSTSQNHRSSIFDNTYGFKVESQQRSYGVVAGFDFGRDVQAANGSATWMFGVMAGYLHSNLDFDNSSTSADFEGGLVGGYMSYIDGGWFVDAKLVANIGDMDYSARAMNTGVKDGANFTSIGGVIDTGYRFNSGAAFIEPGATLSYVSTDLDHLSVFDSTVDFGNDDSLRGRLGVRVGTALFYERYKVEPFMGVSAWYEFAGDNTADVASGGYSLTADDDRGGASAEVSGGVNLFSLNDDGVSAFLKGNVEFGENDLVGYGGHGGVRLRW